jgi:ribosome-associated translation inhibitor RaiA
MEMTSFIFGILSAIVVVFTAGMVFGMVKILARLSSLENFKQGQFDTNRDIHRYLEEKLEFINNRFSSLEREFYGELENRFKDLDINTNATFQDIYRIIDSRTDRLDNKIRELSTSK